MVHNETRIRLGRVIAIAAIAAVVCAMATDLVQKLLTGDANPAVTGGVTGGVVGGLVSVVLSRRAQRREEK